MSNRSNYIFVRKFQMCEDLKNEVDRGGAFAKLLAVHVNGMRAASFEQEVDVDGVVYTCTCFAKSQLPKCGMYGDTPRITIGKYELAEMSNPIDGSIWIEDSITGEGGGFLKSLLEPMIKEFYDSNF